jgi:RND family efflux transporter MFP subunit
LLRRENHPPRNDVKKSIRVVRSFALFALSLLAILALLLSPAAVRAADGTSVVASAVIVPAQVSNLGFLTTALVREIPVNQGDIVQAGQTLAVLDTPEQEYLVKAAEAAYRSAQANAELQHSRTVKTKDFRGRTLIISLPREVYMRATALADVAHASLEVTQATLALSTLTAPYDGTVAAVHVLPGQLVQLDQTVITLATLDKLQIETTDLSERDIPRIKIGQPATVSIEALGAKFPATVIAIAPRAETLGGDVVFKVTLAFDKIPDGLLWGMTAEVTITAESSRERRLTAPSHTTGHAGPHPAVQ